jgi:cation/acetate symporter
VQVYGKLTPGLMWGVLQCALFIATAWLYEIRSARSTDPLEQALTSDAPPPTYPMSPPPTVPGGDAVTLDILSSGVLDPIGSDARRPVIMAFLIFIGGFLLWLFTLATAEEENPERLYVDNRSLSPVINGFALAGEQISVVTLLTVSGGVALFGYDGFTYALDGLIMLGVLLLLAQKIRTSGRYTLGDLYALRASGPGPRLAAAAVTLAITIPLIVIQLRVAGTSTALLVGMTTDGGQLVCTILMGCLVACFAAVAGLRGNSFMHVANFSAAVDGRISGAGVLAVHGEFRLTQHIRQSPGLHPRHGRDASPDPAGQRIPNRPHGTAVHEHRHRTGRRVHSPADHHRLRSSGRGGRLRSRRGRCHRAVVPDPAGL